MQFKDYYSILGLNRSASMAQVKHAFYKLALIYHPDKNPLDPSSSEKFKEILEANDILSNPEKRKLFDKRLFEIQIVNSTYKRSGYTTYSNQKSNKHPKTARHSYTNNTHEYQKRKTFFSDFAATINRKFTSNTYHDSSSVKRANSYRSVIHIPLEEAFHGATRSLHIYGVKIPVQIPPGVVNGKIITYRGLLSDIYPFFYKDLIITVLVDKHPLFARMNQDLFYNLEIDLYTSIFGGKSDIKTLNNKILRLKIPKGTKSGTQLRLMGQGLPFPSNNNIRGDLLVKINVHIPENLSADELEFYKQLCALRKTFPT